MKIGSIHHFSFDFRQRFTLNPSLPVSLAVHPMIHCRQFADRLKQKAVSLIKPITLSFVEVGRAKSNCISGKPTRFFEAVIL